MSVGRAHMATRRRHATSPEHSKPSPFAVWVRKAQVARRHEELREASSHGTERAVEQLRRMLGEERVDYVHVSTHQVISGEYHVRPATTGTSRHARSATAGTSRSSPDREALRAADMQPSQLIRPASAHAAFRHVDSAGAASVEGARAEYRPPPLQQQQQRRQRPQSAAANAKTGGQCARINAAPKGRPQSASPAGRRRVAQGSSSEDYDRRFARARRRPASASARRPVTVPQSRFGWTALSESATKPVSVAAGTVRIRTRPPTARRKRTASGSARAREGELRWSEKLSMQCRSKREGGARSVADFIRSQRHGACEQAASSPESSPASYVAPSINGSRARVHASQTRHGELKAARQAAMRGPLAVPHSKNVPVASPATVADKNDGARVPLQFSPAKRCPVMLVLDLPPAPPEPRPQVRRAPSPATIAAASPERVYTTVFSREFGSGGGDTHQVLQHTVGSLRGARARSRVGSPSGFGLKPPSPQRIRGRAQMPCRVPVPSTVRIKTKAPVMAGRRSSPSPAHMGGGFHANTSLLAQEQRRQEQEELEYPGVSENPNAAKRTVTQLTVRITNPISARFPAAETDIAKW